LYPSLQIKTEPLTGKASQPENKTTIGLVLDEPNKIAQNQNVWKMVVGHDAVVPVMNSKNPLWNEINRQGLTSEDFALLFSGKTSWNKLIDVPANATANCFFINNESVKENFAKYSNTDFEAIKINTAASASELISALSKDVYAIGFCRLADISNTETGSLDENIRLLPIDKNQNGRMDYFEKIYDNLNTFTRGIWIGKYPRELSVSVYAIAPSKPTDKNTVAFLTWMVTDGQKFLNRSGYSFLASNEIQSSRDALLATTELTEVVASEKSLMAKTWPYVSIILIVFALAGFSVYRYAKKNNFAMLDENLSLTPAFDENSIKAPKGLYFDKTHTWAFMESNGMVKIGLDDFMQHITGNITRIKLKETGESVRKGEKIVTIIRDGKQLDIFSPLSGTIVNQNQELKSNPTLINSAPFSEGWIYSIEPKNWLREIQFLFMGDTYQDWLQDEFARLKDFFATYMRSSQAVYSHIVLQDGGALTDNILADMGPEVWEEFQNKFINTSK
jgi:glycine cleavage system H lipoate-binding protein